MSVPIASSRKRSRSPDESAASSYLYPALGRRPSNSTNAPSYPSMIPSHNEYSIGGSSGLSLADGWIDIPYTSNEHLSNDALVASSSFNRNNYSFVGIDVKSNSDPHDQLQEQLDASTAQSKPASAAIGARPKPAPVAKKRPPPPIDSVVLAKSCSRCRVRKGKAFSPLLLPIVATRSQGTCDADTSCASRCSRSHSQMRSNLGEFLFRIFLQFD